MKVLQRSAEARRRVSGIPCGSLWKISGFKRSSKSGKMTRLKISSTCVWSASSNNTCGASRARCSWLIAPWRTSRAAFTDCRERDVNKCKQYWRQARDSLNQRKPDTSSYTYLDALANGMSPRNEAGICSNWQAIRLLSYHGRLGVNLNLTLKHVVPTTSTMAYLADVSGSNRRPFGCERSVKVPATVIKSSKTMMRPEKLSIVTHWFEPSDTMLVIRSNDNRAASGLVSVDLMSAKTRFHSVWELMRTWLKSWWRFRIEVCPTW